MLAEEPKAAPEYKDIILGTAGYAHESGSRLPQSKDVPSKENPCEALWNAAACCRFSPCSLLHGFPSIFTVFELPHKFSQRRSGIQLK